MQELQDNVEHHFNLFMREGRFEFQKIISARKFKIVMGVSSSYQSKDGL